MGRRERLREATRDEIKSIARQQMAEAGTASLSLGGIARSMEMTTPALYRYFASRDELITALIVDAYNALADALEAATATPGSYLERMLAVSLEYRSWALAHPVDFLLLFGNPIPGYQVPMHEVEAAASRVFGVFLSLMQHAYRDGVLRPDDGYAAQAERTACNDAVSNAPDIHPTVQLKGVANWSMIHGMVMLELVGFLGPAVVEPEQFYREECRRLLAAW